MGLLPLLGGCTSAYLVSLLVMRHSIMTERIARRGVLSPGEYVADTLGLPLVRQIASPQVVALRAGDRIENVRTWLNSGQPGSTHQGFPVLNDKNTLVGVLTRRDVLNGGDSAGQVCMDLVRRSPKFVYEDATVRQAVDHMVSHGIGRLPVVSRASPPQVLGMITRSDILSCFRRNLDENRPEPPAIRFAGLRGTGVAASGSPRTRADRT